MNMLGLIFADEHDADVNELTTKRTFAAVPFGIIRFLFGL